MLSLIVPAHNEAGWLPRLLDSVEVAREGYRGGAEQVEVIVADNASTDETSAIARARGCKVVPVEPRVIGAVRNGGAAAARGDLLCFVDADTVIHPDSFNAIAEALASPRVVGGATGVRLDRWSLGIAVTWAAMMPLAWLAGMDTGVVFCRREDFERVGGYPEDRLYAEDVGFLWKLKRLGWSRRPRQRLVRLRTKALASTRKFDQHGDWHYWTRMLPLLVNTALRPRWAERFARRYWYDVTR